MSGAVAKEKQKRTRIGQIVRLKKGGHRYEIMCKLGALQPWRDAGASTAAVADMLAEPVVYENAGKGSVADAAALAALEEIAGVAKGVDRTLALAAYVAVHGEAQVGDAERAAATRESHAWLSPLAAAVAAICVEADPPATGGGKKGKKGAAHLHVMAADVELALRSAGVGAPPAGLTPALAARRAAAALAASGAMSIARAGLRLGFASGVDAAAASAALSKIIAAGDAVVGAVPPDECGGATVGCVLDPSAAIAGRAALAAAGITATSETPNHVPQSASDLSLITAVPPLPYKGGVGEADAAAVQAAGRKKGKAKDADAKPDADAADDAKGAAHKGGGGGRKGGADDLAAIIAGATGGDAGGDSDSDDHKGGGGKKGKKKAPPAKAAPAPKAKPKAAAAAAAGGSDDSEDEAPVAKPKRKGGKAAASDSDSDAPAAAPKPKAKPRTKKGADSDSDESGDAAAKSKPKPAPKAKPAKKDDGEKPAGKKAAAAAPAAADDSADEAPKPKAKPKAAEAPSGKAAGGDAAARAGKKKGGK